MPLSPTATRELLEQLEHLPKKKLGQNFLIDGNIVRKSIEQAELGVGRALCPRGTSVGLLTHRGSVRTTGWLVIPTGP